MPILNYDKRETGMPSGRRLQKCDKCGVEHQGRYMFYSYWPSVTVLCRKCTTVLTYEVKRGKPKEIGYG